MNTDPITRAVFEAAYSNKIPTNAKAVIIAELHEDKSDLMTDYFAHSVEKAIILGFSTHTRDMFSEMRKYAALAPETAHLAGETWDVRAYIGTDINTNGSYYNKGQYSRWHNSETPEPFTSEDSAQEWIDAHPLEPIHFDGVPCAFYWQAHKRNFEHREKYSMGGGYYLMDGYRHGSGWHVCKMRLSATNPIGSIPVGRWVAGTKPAKASKPAAEPVSVGAVTIEEHTHTKKGFQMYIVIVPRVSRDEYQFMLEQCKALGGWYSRQWGTTPGGFAFKDKANADQFAQSIGTGATPPEEPKPGRGDKFRDIADRMQKDIDGKLSNRLSNTPKRLAQSNHARLEGERLQRTQQALRALADHCDAGTVPAVLAGITSKAAIYDLMGTETQQVSNGYHGYSVCTGKPRNTSPEAVALWAMIGGKSEADIKADELRRKVDGLKFSNIPGYFPTPRPVADMMLEHVTLTAHSSILEPSAGSGAILDAVTNTVPINGTDIRNHITAFECNYTLSEILALKGYNVTRGDFMESVPVESFDYVLMNPPFENMQDVEHIQHAFKFLKPGGRLVSVVSESPFFNSTQKAAQFRSWIDDIGAEALPLPVGSFKESGTGVNTRLIIADKL